MADPDLPMDASSPLEYTYPDIDENVQYPWQSSQHSVTEDVPDSVIDPRLYGGSFPEPGQGASQTVAQEYYTNNSDEDDSDDSSDEGSDEGSEDVLDENAQYPPIPNGLNASDDDSDFVNSGADSESESDEDEPAEDDDDDDSAGRRRRRRRGGGRFSGRYGARGGKGIKRGPRKPIEPTPEFKMYHSEATSAFIDNDYDRAIDLVMRAIQVNPEMFPAHSLLSEIFLAQGQKDKALTALFNGAHTRPRDPTVWLKVARLILERAGENRKDALNDVVYCYSRIIEIDPKNFNVRYHRAAIYRELGYNGRAAGEYERILKDRPHNANALRHVAEIFTDLNDVQRAIDYWTESTDYYMTLDPQRVRGFSWNEVNIYAELYSYVGQHEEGLEALKSLSRWLLGRGEDSIWVSFDGDDREWDSQDSPRRIKTNGFVPGQWPSDSYGLGLPLELRIKMGLFRLKMDEKHHEEALHHFEWLNPDDSSDGARIFDYGDLFREVADALKDFGLLNEALRFYSPIQQTTEYADIGFFMAMADCCLQLEKPEDAESCYLTVAEHDSRNMESRVQLAKLYESLGMGEQAFRYVNEAVLIGRQENRIRRRRKDTRLEQLAIEFKAAETGLEPLRPLAPKETAGFTTTGTTMGRRRPQPLEIEEATRAEDIQFLYTKMQELEPRVKEGVYEAIEDWLDIADALLRDFRSNRVFYPMARTMMFEGYSSQRKKSKGKTDTLMHEAQKITGRLQKNMNNAPEEPLLDSVPTEYHGIPFDAWLDIFLQYSLFVTDQGEPEEAYESLYAASTASIWYHNKRQSRQIHVCWFTCALRVQDEEALAHQARWFVKEYQFVTDTYRLFSMLSLLSGDPRKSLFHSSPNMKFMLRQIKAMDFTLPEETSRPEPARSSVWKERASLSTRDEDGNPVPAEELDIALLVLYGHILYSGGSFYPALNYLFRAYALDDQHPAILLSIGLCFIHHSLKRQSENRHFMIMQGLSFMQEYRRVRVESGASLPEQQEVEFNHARVWQGLGLASLAVQGYEKVLEIGEKIRQGQETIGDGDVDMTDAEQPGAPTSISDAFAEDFSSEAAYALQCLHAVGGDVSVAKEVTAKWLVI